MDLPRIESGRALKNAWQAECLPHHADIKLRAVGDRRNISGVAMSATVTCPRVYRPVAIGLPISGAVPAVIAVLGFPGAPDCCCAYVVKPVMGGRLHMEGGGGAIEDEMQLLSLVHENPDTLRAGST